MVSLDIFDVAGRKIVSLVEETRPVGRYSVVWNGLNFHGSTVSSGTYFCRLSVGKDTATMKIIMLR